MCSDVSHCCRSKCINAKYVSMHSIYNFLYICSPEEVYSNLRMKGYHKVRSVLYLEDKVFAVDQHCDDVLIFPAHLKKDLVNMDLFKDYKLIFQVNFYLFSL